MDFRTFTFKGAHFTTNVISGHGCVASTKVLTIEHEHTLLCYSNRFAATTKEWTDQIIVIFGVAHKKKTTTHCSPQKHFRKVWSWNNQTECEFHTFLVHSVLACGLLTEKHLCNGSSEKKKLHVESKRSNHCCCFSLQCSFCLLVQFHTSYINWQTKYAQLLIEWWKILALIKWLTKKMQIVWLKNCFVWLKNVDFDRLNRLLDIPVALYDSAGHVSEGFRVRIPALCLDNQFADVQANAKPSLSADVKIS
jgi:hypothetical protein